MTDYQRGLLYAAKVCRDKAQQLCNDHIYQDQETGAAVWDANSYEAAAIAFTDAADEIEAFASALLRR